MEDLRGQILWNYQYRFAYYPVPKACSYAWKSILLDFVPWLDPGKRWGPGKLLGISQVHINMATLKILNLASFSNCSKTDISRLIFMIFHAAIGIIFQCVSY